MLMFKMKELIVKKFSIFGKFDDSFSKIAPELYFRNDYPNLTSESISVTELDVAISSFRIYVKVLVTARAFIV